MTKWLHIWILNFYDGGGAHRKLAVSLLAALLAEEIMWVGIAPVARSIAARWLPVGSRIWIG